MRDVFDFIADYLHLKRPGSVPVWAMYFLASVLEWLPHSLKVGRARLLTKARVTQFSKGYDLSGVMSPPPLGFVCETRYRVGLAAMLDEYIRVPRGVSE